MKKTSNKRLPLAYTKRQSVQAPRVSSLPRTQLANKLVDYKEVGDSTQESETMPTFDLVIPLPYKSYQNKGIGGAMASPRA